MTEKRIRKAFEHVAPDHLNDVMEQCNAQKQQQKGKILSMTNKAPAPKRSRLPRILAAAAALVLLLTGVGLIMLLSASFPSAYYESRHGGAGRQPQY